jgi:hypothetical protein
MSKHLLGSSQSMQSPIDEMSELQQTATPFKKPKGEFFKNAFLHKVTSVPLFKFTRPQTQKSQKRMFGISLLTT